LSFRDVYPAWNGIPLVAKLSDRLFFAQGDTVCSTSRKTSINFRCYDSPIFKTQNMIYLYIYIYIFFF